VGRRLGQTPLVVDERLIQFWFGDDAVTPRKCAARDRDEILTTPQTPAPAPFTVTVSVPYDGTVNVYVPGVV
jgi:hypothetical protein